MLKIYPKVCNYVWYIVKSLNLLTFSCYIKISKSSYLRKYSIFEILSNSTIIDIKMSKDIKTKKYNIRYYK